MPINTFLAALAFPRAHVIDPFGLFKWPQQKLQHSFSETEEEVEIPRILTHTKPTDFPQRLTHSYVDASIPTKPTTSPSDPWSDKLLFYSSTHESGENTNRTRNHITFTSSLPEDLTNVVYNPDELGQQICSMVVVGFLIFILVYHFYKIISPHDEDPSSQPSHRVQTILSLLTITSILIVIQTLCWKLATNSVIPEILCLIWNVPITLNLGVLSFQHVWLFALKLCSTQKLLLLDLSMERLTRLFHWINGSLGLISFIFGIGNSTSDVLDSDNHSMYCSVEHFQTMWSRFHSASVMILAAQCLFVNYLALKYWIQQLVNRPTETKAKSSQQNAEQSCNCSKPTRSRTLGSMQVCPICKILISSIEVPCEHMKTNVVFLPPQLPSEQEHPKVLSQGLVSLPCLGGQMQRNTVHPISEPSPFNGTHRVKRRREWQSLELNRFIDDGDNAPDSCIPIFSSNEDSSIRPYSTNRAPTDSRANSSSQMNGNMPDRLSPLIVPEARVPQPQEEEVPTSKEMKSEMFDLIFEQKSDRDLFEAARSMRKLHRSLSLRRRFNFDAFGDSQYFDGSDLGSRNRSNILKRSSSDPEVNGRYGHHNIMKGSDKRSKNQIAEQDLIQRLPSVGSSQTYTHSGTAAWNRLDSLPRKYVSTEVWNLSSETINTVEEKPDWGLGSNPWIHFVLHQLVYLPLLIYYIFIDDLHSGYSSILILILGLTWEPVMMIIIGGVLPRCKRLNQWRKKKCAQLFIDQVIVLD